MFLMICLLSGPVWPDLIVNYILFSKPNKIQVCSCFIFDSREMYYFLTAFLDIAIAVCYYCGNPAALYLCKFKGSFFHFQERNTSKPIVVLFPALAKRRL